MKKEELIPQYLQDELREINNIRPPYSFEEITKLKDLFDHTLEQEKQLRNTSDRSLSRPDFFKISNKPRTDA